MANTLVEEVTTCLEGLTCIDCDILDGDDDAAADSDRSCWGEEVGEDDDVIGYLSSRCIFIFFLVGNICFLEGPSNKATSALSVPVGGGAFLDPLSRALRLWKAVDEAEGACEERGWPFL